MAPSSPNFQLVSTIFEGQKGNRAPFWEACHDDIVWRTLVQDSWRCECVGKQPFVDEIFHPLRRAPAEESTTPTRLINGGDVIVPRAYGRSLIQDGQPYDNYNTFVIHFTYGKIARYEEYCDTDLMARALSDRNMAKPAQLSTSAYVLAAGRS